MSTSTFLETTKVRNGSSFRNYPVGFPWGTSKMQAHRLFFSQAWMRLSKYSTNLIATKMENFSQEEYMAILRAIQKGSTTEDVQKILEVADLNRDGFIDFEEFVEVQRKAGGLKMNDMRGAFRTFDLNGDGKISAEEVYELLEQLGENCSLQDCQKMVRAIDTNQDGAVDFDEFST